MNFFNGWQVFVRKDKIIAKSVIYISGIGKDYRGTDI